MSAPYEAPLGMMRAALSQAARAVGPALDIETAGAVLEEAGRIAREVLSPLNQIGDAAASRLTDHGVATPAGFPEAYRRFLEGGWPTICAPAEFGGQALPMLLGAAVTEIWGGANLSFAMCPEVAAGAVEALRMHAPPAIRKRYIPPLVSGEWTASMCLTEPHAGSDLSTLRTLAEPDGQSWRLKGRKIFISWGDHDLAENII
ncbi:MAG: acyl-CoA dehydrogenase family protein, partial [Steroidobacteraceae bacterium]